MTYKNPDWEEIETTVHEGFNSSRLEVPGGWILVSHNHEGLHQIFIKDSKHSWKIKE